MKQTLILLLLALLMTSCRQSPSVFEELRAEDKLESAYHFYPSTLRMLNFQNDTSINKLVKEVRKLSLLSMKPEVMTGENLGQYCAGLQKEKNYDLYLEIVGPDYQYYIIGDGAAEKTLAFIGQQERCYILDVDGKIDFMQLPQAFQSLSQQDSSQTSGYSMLFDLMQEDADNEARRRAYRKRRKEEREAREAEKKMPADTTIHLD